MATPPVFASAPAQVIAQLTGYTDPLYDPFPPLTPMNATLEVGFFAGDICGHWPMGYGNKVAYFFGDVWGPAWRGGNRDQVGGSAQTRTAALGPVAASTFTGTQTFTLNNSVAWVAPGYILCQTGVGPAGWAVFSFTGRSGPNLLNCTLVAGGGTISPGQDVYLSSGPGLAPGTGNALAVSADTNLVDGITLAFYKDAAGVMKECWPFNFVTQTFADVFPGAGDQSPPIADTDHRIIGIDAITRLNNRLTVTLDADHPFTDTNRYPNGPTIYLGGVNAPVLKAGGGENIGSAAFTGGTGGLTLAGGYDTTLLAPGTAEGGTAAEARITIQVGPSAGAASVGIAVIQYATRTATTLTGCTRISGIAGTTTTGFVTTNGAINQGVDGINETVKVVYDLAAARTLTILNVGPTRVGGKLQALCYLHVPNLSLKTADPVTATRQGWFPTGGFSVSRGTAFGDYRDYRQFAFLQSTSYQAYPVSLDLVYTDDNLEGSSITWTYVGSWVNAADSNSPTQGACAYDDVDLVQDSTRYIYAWFGPGNILGRILPANAHTFSAWQYSTGPLSTDWSSNIASAVAISFPAASYLGTIQGVNGVTSSSIIYDPTLDALIMGYVPLGGVSLLWRSAYDLKQGWSASKAISIPMAPNTDPLATSTGYGYLYGCFLHCFASRHGNPAGVQFPTFTVYASYQTYLARLPLSLPAPGAEEDLTVVKSHVDVVHVGGSEDRDSRLVSPDLAEWDGWFTAEGTWEILTSLSMRRAGNVTGFLSKYDPMSIHDGTAVRMFNALAATYDGGTNFTTVSIVPHNDGASAGNVLLTGGAVSAFRYSKMNRPQGFPGTFTWDCIPTGWAAGLFPAGTYTFYLRGGRFYGFIRQGSTGTSNATTKTFPLPVGLVAATRAGELRLRPACITDPTAGTSIPAAVSMSSAGTAISAFTNVAGSGVWANSGASRVNWADVDVELA